MLFSFFKELLFEIERFRPFPILAPYSFRVKGGRKVFCNVAHATKSMALQPLRKSMGVQSIRKSMPSQAVAGSMGVQPVGGSMALRTIGKSIGVAAIGRSMAIRPVGKSTAIRPVGKSTGVEPVGLNLARFTHETAFRPWHCFTDETMFHARNVSHMKQRFTAETNRQGASGGEPPHPSRISPPDIPLLESF